MCELEADVEIWVDEPTLDSNVGLNLVYTLEQDPNRKEQLAGFRDETSDTRRKAALHRKNEQQLLEEGKLAQSENRRWFRFRTATVEAEFQQEQPRADTSVDDEVSYTGPLVLEFYPRLIRGHVRSIAETHNFSVSMSPPPLNTPTISATWSMSKPKESAHVLQGRVMGNPATRVRWTVHESEESKSGVYEQFKFVVIVRHSDQAQFSMALKIRARTLAGLPIVGNGGSHIIFTPNQPHDANENNQPMGLHWLNGGSIRTCGQTWMPAAQGVDGQEDLAEENLEELTQMEAVLLGKHGPGAPPVDNL